MRAQTITRGALTALAILSTGWLVAPAALAMCVPFVPDNHWIAATGQLNFVVMDRENDRIHLIPNIGINTDSDDFAVVVPTPTVPEFAPADHLIWDEARQLTLPLARRRGNSTGGFDCGTTVMYADQEAADGADVVIVSTHTVGDFEMTVLEATDPDALADWLTANGYLLEPAHHAALAPYVERGWYFTAMKVAESANLPVPDNGLNLDVDPVMISWAGDGLEVPLPLLAINMRDWGMEVVLYVVDDHRMNLPNFETSYANRISASELEAIDSRHPIVAGHLAEGRFLTKLSRGFRSPQEMSAPVELRQAATDEEFRKTFGGTPWIAMDMLLLGVPWLIFRRPGFRRPH